MTPNLTLIRALTQAMVERLDPAVATLVEGCDFDGRGECDWTCRLHHLYVEVRSAWHDAGGVECDLPSLRLTREGRPLRKE